MTVRGDWRHEGRTWLHPVCEFFVVEREAPELAGGGAEYHVVRSGGDSTAGLSVSVFPTAEEAIADAERRDSARRAKR